MCKPSSPHNFKLVSCGVAGPQRGGRAALGVACRLATQNGFVWRKGEGTAGRLFSFICNSSRYHECKTLDYISLLHFVMLASGT